MLLKVPRFVRGPGCQKYFTLLLASIALLFNNSLYSSLLQTPLDHLRTIPSFNQSQIYENYSEHYVIKRVPEAGPGIVKLGILYFQKPTAQLLCNLFTGILMDRIGYKIPFLFGLLLVSLSTVILFVSLSYWSFLGARILQGIACAFTDTAAFAIIADKFFNHTERTISLSFALTLAYFGYFCAPLLINILFKTIGISFTFLLLTLPTVIVGILFLLLIKNQFTCAGTYERTRATTVCGLILDTHISIPCCAVIVAKLFPALIEPLLSTWLVNRFHFQMWQLDIISPACFVACLLAIIVSAVFIIKWSPKFSTVILVGLVIEGVFMAPFPFRLRYWQVLGVGAVAIYGHCLVISSVFVMLANLVDMRHEPVYGSVFALFGICDAISYCTGFGMIFVKELFFWSIAAIIMLVLLCFLLVWMVRPIYRPPAPMEESFVMVHQSL